MRILRIHWYYDRIMVLLEDGYTVVTHPATDLYIDAMTRVVSTWCTKVNPGEIVFTPPYA